MKRYQPQAGDLKTNRHRGGFAAETPLMRPDPTLIQRIGGTKIVHQVVDALYDRIEQDPELRLIFPTRPRRDEPKRFFLEWLGGESRYTLCPHTNKGLQRVHYPFAISKRGAGLWLSHMKGALGECGLSKQLTAEIMARLRPLALRMVNEPKLPVEMLNLKPTCAGIRSENAQRLQSLQKAAARGDLEAIRTAITNNPELITKRGEDGRTLFWEAVRNGRQEVIACLSQHGADVNAPGCIPLKVNFPFTPPRSLETLVSITPYCLARWRGYDDIADLLLANGAIVDIYSAAYLGDHARVSELLESHPDLLNAEDPAEDFFAITPLHHAVCGEHNHVVELLLKKGAAVRHHSMWLLTFAVRRNRVDLVKRLLEHGADASQSILLGSLDGEDRAIADLLIDHGFDVDNSLMWGALIVRASRGDSGGDQSHRIRALLKYGADLGARNADGNTALHFAAKGRLTSVVAVLLDHRAEVNAKNNAGETPLATIARTRAKRNSAEIPDMLLAHGASVNTTDSNGETPLFAAVKYKHKELVKWLMKNGAAVDMKNRQELTPLDIVRRGRRKESAEIAAILQS